jgi:hypothetical protein
MRTIAGILVAVSLVAALGVWMGYSPRVSSTAPAAEASMLPIELMRKSDRNLPDNTPREPF